MSQLAAAVFRSAQFTFIGRAGRDADAKFFDNGGQKAKCRIAVSQGKNEEAEWFTVEAWDEAAAVLADVTKGQMLKVIGRVAVETYQKRNGEEATDHIIKASHVEVLPSRGGDRQPASAPARRSGQQQATSAWNANPGDFDEDEPPF